VETLDLRHVDRTSAEGVEALGRALEVIGAAGVLAFPTDTVWGLGTCSQDPAQIDRIFRLKGRDDGKPISYLIPSVEALEVIFEQEVPAGLEDAGREHWPGATSLVVAAPPEILPAGRRGAPGVGLRIPDHALLRHLLTGLPPMAATSANLSGQPPLETAEEIAEVMGPGLDLLVLMDPPRLGQASQVLRLAPDGSTQVLLPGAPA